MRSDFTESVIEIIRAVPRGRVCSYGGVAAQAGNPRAARQVVRVLHSCSEKERLPWWRVVNSRGTISLKRGYGFEEQLDRLKAEGIECSSAGRIDLERYGWERNG